MKHIVDSLNMNMGFARNQVIRIYDILANMSSYSQYCYNVYDSDLFEVLEFKSLIEQDWGKELLSVTTFAHLKQFYQAWQSYRMDDSYRDDEIFVYLDNEWRTILNTNLLPLLNSFEQDFDIKGIEYKSYKTYYSVDSRPTDSQIVERAKHLYDLLLKNKIIKRHYME